MKKIAFYIANFNKGGAERVMSNLIEYFFQKGYEIVVINDEPSEDHYNLPKGIHRFFLSEQRDKNFVLRTVKRIFGLRSILKRERPDIVLSFLGEPNYRMLMATAGMSVKKVVSVRNDPNLEYGKTSLKHFLANVLFSMADGAVFQTEDAAKYFKPSIQAKGKIILNPVNPVFFQCNREGEGRHIISVARLSAQKNYPMLLNAYAKIEKEFPQDDLLLFGEGEERENLTQLRQALGLEKRVRFMGRIDEVEKELMKAKLFVLSSDYEGMPNALMEAMAVGVPVISTDCPCGGPKTLIRSQNEGVLVEVGNTEQLAQEMRRVLSDTALREALSNGERARAKDFESSKILAQWDEYFHSITQ